MIGDVTEILQRVMESTPEQEWIVAAQKELPDLSEDEIIELIMFLNVGDVDEVKS